MDRDDKMTDILVEARYLLEFRDDGVFLKISPSGNGITKDDETRILDYIKRKNIKNIDSTAVFTAMCVNINDWVKIANTQQEELLNQEIEVKITNGGMKAYARLLPEDGGDRLTLENAITSLNRQGVVFGINDSAIEKMLNQEKYYEEIVVAQGLNPKNGQDAKLNYHIDFNRVVKPHILEDGTVDYRHLDLIINVKKGQLLVDLVPPTKGIPGKTVTGKTVVARSGKNLSMPMGRNVVLSKDRLSLLSKIDGKAEMIDGKIHVYAVYEVMDNVDNSTGNIDFIGNVIVNGNVLTGFEIKAGGYIEIRGVVEGAKLSAQGDIVLKQGMQGMGRGSIQSQGNVVARFIENGRVTAKGDILAEAILHSVINCGGKIQVTGKKGLIAGGSITAGLDISAVNIGSPMATITELEVGISPILREEYTNIIVRLEKFMEELKKADQILELLKKMESKCNLSPDKIKMRLKAIKTKLAYAEEIPGLRARIAELEEMFKAVSAGKINIRGTVYPGVKITIGASGIYIKDQEQYVTFIREHGDIVRTTFLG